MEASFCYRLRQFVSKGRGRTRELPPSDTASHYAFLYLSSRKGTEGDVGDVEPVQSLSFRFLRSYLITRNTPPSFVAIPHFPQLTCVPYVCSYTARIVGMDDSMHGLSTKGVPSQSYMQYAHELAFPLIPHDLSASALHWSQVPERRLLRVPRRQSEPTKCFPLNGCQVHR